MLTRIDDTSHMAAVTDIVRDISFGNESSPSFSHPLSAIPIHIREVERTMAHFSGVQGLIASYVASPQGREMVRNFLSSPEGQRAISTYLATPEGQGMAKLLLIKALDNLSLPEPLKDEIRAALRDEGDPAHSSNYPDTTRHPEKE